MKTSLAAAASLAQYVGQAQNATGCGLWSLRKERGLSQEGLALEADLQRNYVSLIERGINQPTVTTIFELALALKVRPSEMIA